MSAFCDINKVKHYLPLREETKVYQRRKVKVTKPVFPGYLFAQVDYEKRTTLFSANHILKYFVPHDEDQLLYELDQIRKALSSDPTLLPCEALTIGKRVRITGGPFMGIEGKIDSIKKKTKIRLNVDMIGQAISVEVEKDLIERID